MKQGYPSRISILGRSRGADADLLLLAFLFSHYYLKSRVFNASLGDTSETEPRCFEPDSGLNLAGCNTARNTSRSTSDLSAAISGS
jgi:hypothetical protein